MRKSILKLLTVFVILLSQSSFAQHYTIRQIDSIIFTIPRNKKFNKENSLGIYNRIIESSKKLNYPRGIAYGNYNIAFALYLSGNYDDSFKYIDLVNKEEYTQTDNDLIIRVYDLMGCNYSALGFYDLAKDAFKKESKESDKIKIEKDESITKSRIYGQLDYILSLQKNDSFGYYSKKAYRALDNVSEKDAFQNLASLYPNLISYYSNHKKPDSVKYIIKKALGFLERNMNTNYYAKYSIYYYVGYDAHNRKDYKEALRYYLKAEDAIGKTDYLEFRKNLYKNMAGLYKEMDSVREEKDYLTKYVSANDTITNHQKIGAATVVKKVVKEANDNLNKSQSQSYWTITIIALLVAAGAFVSLVFYKKIKKKEAIIIRTQKETHELSQKLNDAFEEIIELAKTNSPNFLVRFKEVYPDFYNKMLEMYPNIQNTELLFCAYLRLDFSTKDIANYTFVTPKTVEMRRYRLRKKLNIPTEMDMYIWMKSLDEKDIHSHPRTDSFGNNFRLN